MQKIAGVNGWVSPKGNTEKRPFMGCSEKFFIHPGKESDE